MAMYIGSALLLAGSMLAWRYKKRIFTRTNRYGIEEFESFFDKVKAKAADFLLSVLSMSLICVGLFLVAQHFESSWGWIVTLPCYLFALYLLLGS